MSSRIDAEAKRSYFEEQREALISEICHNMSNVLSNLNTLNQSLEDMTILGKEFENVALVWDNLYDGLHHMPSSREGGEASQP